MSKLFDPSLVQKYDPGRPLSIGRNIRSKQGVRSPDVKPEKYLSGKIPLRWIALNCRLGLPAIKTALALWHQSKCEESLIFRFNQSSYEEQLNLSRFSARKGLRALESAGLVAILKSGRGRKITVQLLQTGLKEIPR